MSVKQTDRDKTAFVPAFGTYRFKRIPFDLKNAPASFQRLINRFRAGLKDLTTLAYSDDLIVLSDSFEKHMNYLKEVFQRLRTFHLRKKECVCLPVRQVSWRSNHPGRYPGGSRKSGCN